MSRIRRTVVESEIGTRIPLLLTSIGMAIGLYVVSHPGLLAP